MRLSATFGIALGLSAVLSVVAAGKPSSNTPVTSIINTYDSGVAPALQIQDDGLGRYANSSTQSSLILANGDWRLDDYDLRGATRMISFVFSQPIPGTGPNGGAPVAPTSGAYIANFGANCANFNNSFLTLQPGATMSCPLEARFDSGGKTYVLHMAPVGFPDTDPVNITCIFPTTGTKACSQWRIQPSVAYTYTGLDGTPQQGWRSVANLSIETTAKGKTVDVKQGDFYFSFSILVTNP